MSIPVSATLTVGKTRHIESDTQADPPPMTLPKRGEDDRRGPEEGASCLLRISRRHTPFGVKIEGEVAIAYEGRERERERER